VPLAARIIAAANAYDAMLTEQPFAPARSHAEALEELHRCAGAQFDATVVDALERVIARAGAPRETEVEAPA
jgi:HD-GYP domain-containing protein (c-di-GMP phosphodiesterase class II)